MIERAARTYQNFQLGSICLSVDKLIEIIESKGFSKVTAENNDIVFSDINDIKLHKSLLSGYPSISCDEIQINFLKHGPHVTAYLYRNPSSAAVAESIQIDISSQKSFIDILNDKIKNYYIILLIIVATTPYLYSKYNLNYISDEAVQVLNFIAFILLSILMIYNCWKFYADIFRKRVFYRSREGFWARNWERIVLLIVGSALTILIAQLGKIAFG